MFYLRSEWAMCGTFTNRAAILSHSTFTLLLPPETNSGDSLIVSPLFLNRLAEALRVGAIPIILGPSNILPYHEFIEWDKATIIIAQVSVNI